MYPDGHPDEGQLFAFDCDSPRPDLLLDDGGFQFIDGGFQFDEGGCEFNKEPTAEHCVCARG